MTSRSITHSRSALVAVAAIAALALAGCSPTAVAQVQHPSSSPSSSLSVDNCGTTVDFGSTAPKHVITIKSTSTEMLLALGLGDRIVGTAFQDGPVPAKWEKAAAKLPVLAEKVPSQEAVLAASPDLIYAGWESNFSPDGAGARTDLQNLGVKTYVSPAACQEPAFQPKKLGFKDVFEEIDQVAAIFHVNPAKLIASQKKTLASITPDKRKPTALWFSSGSSVPYVGAGIGAPELIMKTAGLTNIAASVKQTWTSYNWESVIAVNPDVIVLVDASWSTVQKKIGVLEGNPATAALDAVKNHRYVIVPFAASEAGVRTVEAAADVAKQLQKLQLK
ncbi:putative F420-0 ABC transporter substrate-binding protein [Parafrigoribacterium soli]|uniref:putative F420-0 ABC transporter substrate-binding protein n=1 Tax=Parafrigoribacterium soli TaxID=3144663 RepID=UPI0032EFC5AF